LRQSSGVCQVCFTFYAIVCDAVASCKRPDI